MVSYSEVLVALTRERFGIPPTGGCCSLTTKELVQRPHSHSHPTALTSHTEGWMPWESSPAHPLYRPLLSASRVLPMAAFSFCGVIPVYYWKRLPTFAGLGFHCRLKWQARPYPVLP